ncbi:Hypothetical protein A7982_10087 [Minicystis rosea]|nr:Hypothetical protein A7982_10087 [Minicystis rosea]
MTTDKLSSSSSRAMFVAALSLATLAPALALADSPGLMLVNRLWGVGEVQYVEKDGGKHVLETFKEPHSVRQASVSSNGRWAYVWHQGAKPPLQLSIYDLATWSRTASFTPGFGGDMYFTPGASILHWWGCGSDCAEFVLYDTHGKKRLSGGTSIVSLSPTSRFMITGPSLFAGGESIVLYDLDAARILYETPAALQSRFRLEEVVWDEARGAVALKLVDGRKKARRLLLDTSKPSAVKASFPDGEPKSLIP